MIEMLGVLAIIGVLTVGGFSLVNKVTTTHKANTVIDETGVLANKTRTIFREFVYDNKDSMNTTAISMDEYVSDARAYPESLALETSGFVDKDDVLFNIYAFRDSGVDYFYIQVSQLSEDLCMALSQSNWGSPSINGYVGICIGTCTNGGVVNGSDNNTAKGGAKMSLDGSATYCQSGADNTVSLTFR